MFNLNLNKIASLLSLMAFLFHSTVFGWKFIGANQQDFFNQIPLSNSINGPIGQFFTNSSDVENYEYIQKIYQQHLEQVKKALSRSAFTKQLNCASELSVNIGKTYTTSRTPLQKDFESELIEIESFGCLPKADITKTFELYLSDNFMLAAHESLKQSVSRPDENKACQNTSTFPIGESQYCIQYNLFKDDNTMIITSYNDMNNSAMRAPVYLRLVSTVFKKQLDGTIAFYALTYGRGPDLPFHSIVKNKVKSENLKFVDFLKQQMLR